MRAAHVRRFGAFFLTTLALFVSLITAAPAGAAPPRASVASGIIRQPRVAGPSFGVTAHFMWHSQDQTTAELNRIQAASFKTVRFDLGWRWVEPQRKGAYDQAVLRQLDWTLRELDARGIAPIITVIETPTWARPAGTGIFTPPTNRQDYADLLEMLAARYASRPNMVWEIWNEPNLAEFWQTGPNPAEYADLLNRAYGAIKTADPDATVLGGSIVFNDLKFLEGMYAAGVAGHFDALSIHPYTGGRAPDDGTNSWFSLRGQLTQLHGALAAHGEGAKPLYVTEFGWSTDDVPDATRATYLRQAVAIMREYPYVRAASVYTINQADYPSYGLVTTAGVETVSWQAYAAAAR
jgi:hypothetical protein